MTANEFTNWHKSSFSPNNSGCVEIASNDTTVAVRDTKDNSTGPILRFTHAEWGAFLAGVRAGEFDHH